MKDRITQYPHRYQLVPVSGQSDTYDIIAKPGTVTEVGTPLNKANLLSDTTANLYGLTGDDATVDGALIANSFTMNYGKYSQLSGGTGLEGKGPSIMAFTTQDNDDFGAINLPSYPTRLTIPQGISKVRFYLMLAAMHSDNITDLFLDKNGVELLKITANDSSLQFSCTPIIHVVSGDYFEVRITGSNYTALQAGSVFGMEAYR